MSYINRILAANEKILTRTRPHLFILFARIFKELLILAVLIVGYFAIQKLEFNQTFLFQIVFAVLGVIVLLSLLLDVLHWRNEEFLVTSRRVIHASGVLNKKILDSSLSKINDVILEQSWLGRIFNYGTIRILTATEEVINLLDHISNPIAFKHAMLDAKAQLEPMAVPAATAAPSATQLLEELAQLKARNMITEEEYQEKRKEILKRL